MKWINVVPMGTSDSGKTLLWNLLTKDGSFLLGKVSWHGPWRKYTFEPAPGYRLVFEQDCLRDIADFIETATREHREKAKVTR